MKEEVRVWRDGVPCDPLTSPGTVIGSDGKPIDLHFERALREAVEKAKKPVVRDGGIPTAPLNL